MMARYILVVIICFVFYRLVWFVFPSVSSIWELQASDQLLRLAHSMQEESVVSPEIVFIDLDDKSIETIEYPPSDPRLYAELINILSEAGVHTILVDILFPHCKDEGCIQLAQRVKAAGNVNLAAILSITGESAEPLDDGRQVPYNLLMDFELPEADELKSGKVVMSNGKVLDAAAAGIGHINCAPDLDGVYRRIPLLVKTEEGVVPAIALRAAMHYLNHPATRVSYEFGSEIVLHDASLPDGRVLDIIIPVSEGGENRINFSGLWSETFAHYSVATILKAGATPAGRLELINELDGSLAILSDVSTGSRDFGAVPIAPWFPLSGVHGNLINSIFTNNFIAGVSFAESVYFDLVLASLLVFIAIFASGWRFAILAVLLFWVMFIAPVIIFLHLKVIFPLVRPALSMITGMLALLLLQYLREQQDKQHMHAKLVHYFAPALMEKILYDPEIIQGVKKKQLTVLFSDIADFTSWSSTREPEEIHETLSLYFEEMAEIVFACGGTIDKYMGDGLLVFFGDPEPDPNHAKNAVYSACRMQEKVVELRKQWQVQGGMEIMIRIGIHTGEVVVGNMGSQSRMDYTVIGSHVNLAQRLESNCPPGKILISEQVREQLGGEIPVVSAGKIKVKGFSDPVAVYTVEPEGQQRGQERGPSKTEI